MYLLYKDEMVSNINILVVVFNSIPSRSFRNQQGEILLITWHRVTEGDISDFVTNSYGESWDSSC